MLNATGRRIALAAMLVVTPLTAQAQLITDAGAIGPAITTLTDFGLNNTSVAGPYSSVIGGANNIRMDYAGDFGLYFDYCDWGLGSKGDYCGPGVGVNQNGSLRFTFQNGPVASVGILMNYAIPFGEVFIRALDGSSNVLAEYELLSAAPIASADFEFRGIGFGSAQISAFELYALSPNNPSPILQSLSFSPSATPVPEPATMLGLLAVGFVGLASVARRRTR